MKVLVHSLDCLHNELENLFFVDSFISPSLFRNLRNLKKLVLQDVQIIQDRRCNFDNDLFDSLVNLEYLKVVSSKDQLTLNPQYLPKLKWLNLKNFAIDQQFIENIHSCQKLCVLKLNGSDLTSNILIENFLNLRCLYFSNELFKKNFKLEFGENNNKLEFLSLPSNLELNESILKLTSLKTFHLGRIEKIEDSFHLINKLNSLEKFNLELFQQNYLDSSNNTNNSDYISKLTDFYLFSKANKLISLQSGLFDNLKQLKSLKLKSVLIENGQDLYSQFNSNFHSFKVNLENCLFSSQIGLEELKIEFQLEFLQPKLFDGLENLKKLDLSRNKIKEMQPELFSHLKQLREINMSFNSIKQLQPRVFTESVRFENLKLNNNFIKIIENNALEGLENLVSLDLSGNMIEKLEKNFFYTLNQLKRLEFGANHIQILDNEVFSNLGSLEYLGLEGNRVKEIGKDVFKGLGNLKNLNLSRNQIDELSPDVFSHLNQLEELNLYGNRLKFLVNPGFVWLNSLQKLDLSNNQIRNIENEVFKGVENLRKLDLTDNKLGSNICLNVFRGLKRLETFKVDDFGKKNEDIENEFVDYFGKTLLFND